KQCSGAEPSPHRDEHACLCGNESDARGVLTCHLACCLRRRYPTPSPHTYFFVLTGRCQFSIVTCFAHRCHCNRPHPVITVVGRMVALTDPQSLHPTSRIGA